MSSRKTIDPAVQVQVEEIARIVTDAARRATGDFYGGKRSHKRFFASNPFEIDAPSGETPQVLPVRLHDISASGLSCWSKHRVNEDAPLRVREFSSDESGVWLSARVTHCTPGIRGFLVGAEFDFPAGEEVLDKVAADEQLPTVEASPPNWWRRLLSAFGLHPKTA